MAGKEFKTTIVVGGEVEQSVLKSVASISGQMEKLQRIAVESASATDKLTATIDLQSDELKRAKKAYQDYILNGDKSSEQAKELAKEVKRLSNELNDNKRKLSDAEDAADKLEGELKETRRATDNASDGFTMMKGVISNLIANGISALVGSVRDAIGSLWSLSEETQEYREDIAKLNTAFTTMGHTTEEATAVYKELYSVFGEEDRAVEAAQQIAALSKNQAEMTRMTNIATGAWARWGDSLATESLMEAINATSKIQNGKVQGTLADALEWAGVNLDNFNKDLEVMNDEQERSEYILKTLEGLYGKAAENYRITNASIIENRRVTSDNTDALAKAGATLEPLMTQWSTLKTELVVGAMPAIQSTTVALIDSLTWMRENEGAVIAIISVLGVLITALAIYKTAKAVKLAMDAAEVTSLWALVSANWALFTAGMAALWPIALIVLGIAAVIAIIVICVKYWDKIADAALAAVDWIVEAWGSVANWINGNVVQPIAGFFSNLWDGITGMVSGIVAFFKDGFTSLVGIVKSPINAIIGIINGAIDGINSIGFDIPDWVPFIGGKAFKLDIPKLPMLATGGFTDGVSIAGEAGMEAVISFDPKYRQENLSYWAKAGRMLGADTSDFFLGVGGSTHTSVDLGGVTFAPNITVTGNATKETIMKAIEDEYPDFLDMLESYLKERQAHSYA